MEPTLHIQHRHSRDKKKKHTQKNDANESDSEHNNIIIIALTVRS